MGAFITVDLDDVVKAGSVEKAIEARCQRSDTTSSGTIGTAFATSGPGSGWSKEFDVSDYAERAMAGGALYYVDSQDGRVARSPEWEDGLYSGQPIEWSDESEVEILCPDLDEAREYPNQVEEMAQSVLDYHAAKSDCYAWVNLIQSIRCLEEALVNGSEIILTDEQRHQALQSLVEVEVEKTFAVGDILKSDDGLYQVMVCRTLGGQVVLYRMHPGPRRVEREPGLCWGGKAIWVTDEKRITETELHSITGYHWVKVETQESK